MRSKIVKMVGRKEKKSFVVEYTDESCTSPQRKQLLDQTTGIDVRFERELFPLTPDPDNRSRVRDSQGDSFVQMMTTSSVSVYVNESPSRERTERKVQFSDVRQRLFTPQPTQEFEFTVTANDVEKRLLEKRPLSQKQAKGQSANELFEEYGAIIVRKTKKKIESFHLAHRHGWVLGGPQDANNLDPSTAGSNYATLFTIESPLIHLVLEEGIEQINVTGKVHFDLRVPVPCKIVYDLSWGNGRTAQVSTYPLDRRSPTLDEHEVAKATLSITRTPQKKRTAQMAELSPSVESTDGEEVEEEIFDSDFQFSFK